MTRPPLVCRACQTPLGRFDRDGVVLVATGVPHRVVLRLGCVVLWCPAPGCGCRHEVRAEEVVANRRSDIKTPRVA